MCPTPIDFAVVTLCLTAPMMAEQSANRCGFRQLTAIVSKVSSALMTRGACYLDARYAQSWTAIVLWVVFVPAHAAQANPRVHH